MTDYRPSCPPGTARSGTTASAPEAYCPHRTTRITYATGTMVVHKAKLTVAVGTTHRLVGQPDPAFPVTYTGLIPGDTAADLSGSLTFAVYLTHQRQGQHHRLLPNVTGRLLPRHPNRAHLPGLRHHLQSRNDDRQRHNTANPHRPCHRHLTTPGHYNAETSAHAAPH